MELVYRDDKIELILTDAPIDRKKNKPQAGYLNAKITVLGTKTLYYAEANIDRIMGDLQIMIAGGQHILDIVEEERPKK